MGSTQEVKRTEPSGNGLVSLVRVTRWLAALCCVRTQGEVSSCNPEEGAHQNPAMLAP